ncbi:MAG TPA: hypothetical protein VFS77_14030, partial [Pyrinomonadaceae bacterium]|nr:hypothetical protein [Pyrinomonadaceae bacterium]
MSIEVTSVPDLRRIRNRIVSVVLILCLTTLAFAGDAVIRSYNHHSKIIDARLASGYLTSRPGLYAAPRVLQVEQKYSVEKLVSTLRRAGYIESPASNVWSGSFVANGSIVEIRPSRGGGNQPGLVRVTFDAGQISNIT